MLNFNLLGFLPGSIGFQELIVILAVAVLLFGSRLPEVARSLGQSYNQFKKGLMEIKSTINAEIDSDSNSASTDYGGSSYRDVDDDYDEPTTSGFEPPSQD